jgi:hypothetical protein
MGHAFGWPGAWRRAAAHTINFPVFAMARGKILHDFSHFIDKAVRPNDGRARHWILIIRFGP